MNVFKNLALFFLLLNAYCLIAQSSSERLQQAYQFQTALQYDQAIEQYQSLMEEGCFSSDLYFNTAMAYYGKEDLGQAILYLEKAARIAPLDEQVTTNLQLLQNEQKDALLPLPKFFIKAWWDGIASFFRPNTWSILAIFFSILTAFTGFLWLKKKKTEWRKIQLLAMPSFIVLAFLCLFLGNSRAKTLAANDEAVVVAPLLELYIAPGEDTDIDSEIHAGLKVDVLDEFEEWMKIRLVDGREGWVKLTGMAVI